MNGRRSWPSRVCLKRAGPGVVSRTSTATAPSSGENTSRHTDATTRSKNRLPRSEDRPDRPARRSDFPVSLSRASAKAGPCCRQRVPHGLAHQGGLPPSHMREYREREDSTGGAFGDRKGAVGEASVGRLQMAWDRVVDLSLDSRRCQLTSDFRAIRHQCDREVIGAAGAWFLRHEASGPVLEGLAVLGGDGLARFGPGVKPGELCGQYQGLQCVKAAVGPDKLVLLPGKPGPA